MALVDYSSDDEPPSPGLPPLPAAFHNLYASTVRRSVVDDPSLHQGRRRQTPHVAGQWPTHVYVEWHPMRAQHDTLDAIVGLAAADLRAHDADATLYSALTSDLGAPLPLHISLSRPLSLPTADKDAFVARLTQAVRRAGPAFAVRPTALAWHSSPGSGRTFLVLGVAGPGLAALLARCNATAALFGQPALYAADAAFHVSIAWTLGRPGDGAAPGLLLQSAPFRRVRAWEMGVAGVKAKMGNVVSHIPLAPRH